MMMQRNWSLICCAVNHIGWTVLGVMLRCMSYQSWLVSIFRLLFFSLSLYSSSSSFSSSFLTFASFFIICYIISDFDIHSVLCWLIKYQTHWMKTFTWNSTEMWAKLNEPHQTHQYTHMYIKMITYKKLNAPKSPNIRKVYACVRACAFLFNFKICVRVLKIENIKIMAKNALKKKLAKHINKYGMSHYLTISLFYAFFGSIVATFLIFFFSSHFS